MNSFFIVLLLALDGVSIDPFIRIEKIIQTHCTHCHNDENILDLRALPPERDSKTWIRILEMLESSKMPPPDKADSLERRFPLDPEMRMRLIEDISLMLGTSFDPSIRPRHLSHGVWGSIVSEIALSSGVLPSQLESILGTSGGFLNSMPPDWIAPIHQVRIDSTSHAVCKAIDTAEFLLPLSKRRLLAHMPSSSIPNTHQKDLMINALFSELYGDLPNKKDLRDGRILFRKFRSITENWREVWIAVCTTYLSGPRFLYQSYLRF